MKPRKPATVEVSEEMVRPKGRESGTTRPVQLKNRSSTESMLDVVFVFLEANTPAEERRMAFVNELKPQQRLTKLPTVNGASVSVTACHFEWDYQGFTIVSSERVAASGYYYDTFKLTAEPNDSYESFRYKQKPL